MDYNFRGKGRGLELETGLCITVQGSFTTSETVSASETTNVNRGVRL